MTTYIAITDNHGDCQTYLTDTAEQRAEARAALRALNEPFAPVWAGEPDGTGDSHRNGEVLYADEPAAVSYEIVSATPNGHVGDRILFSTRERADDELVRLAASFGCDESELRIVERAEAPDAGF